MEKKYLQEHEKSQGSITTLNNVVKDLKEKMRKMEDEALDYESKIQEIQSQAEIGNVSRKDYEDLQSKYLTAQSECKTVKDELTKFKRQSNFTTTSNANLVRESDQKSQRIAQQQKEIEAAEARNATLELELEESMRKNEELLHQMVMAQEAKDDLLKITQNANVVTPVKKARKPSVVASFFERPKVMKKSAIGVPEKEGFLQRQSGKVMKKWKKEYFSLAGDTLYWFKDHNSEDVKGTFSLEDCTLSTQAEQTKKVYSFGITSPTSRKVILLANSQSDMDDWSKSLMKHSK